MGYVHDTAMAQYIPPTLFHFVSATAVFTHAAGAVTDTIAINRAVATEATTINVPIVIPSNSVASKGAKLTSIEIDYEIFTAAATAMTALIYKVTRGADLAVAVVSSAIPFTQTPVTTVADDVDQHKLILTITTPTWLDNDEYYLVELTLDAAATTTAKFYGAVANFTLRV